MRKNKLVAILLAMIMTLASIGTVTVFAKDGKPPMTTPSVEESTGAGEQTGNNADKVEKWLSYLSYQDAAEAVSAWDEDDLTEIFKEANGEMLEVSTAYADTLGWILVTTTKNIVKTFVDPEAVEPVEEEVHVATHTKKYIYEAATMTELWHGVQFDVIDFEKGGYTQADEKFYSLSVSVATGTALITQTTYKPTAEDETVFETVYGYNVMLKDGTKLSETWEGMNTYGEAVTANSANHIELTWKDKVYVMKNMEVIATFDKGMQHALPDFDNVTGTACFTQGDYTYLVDELPMQPISVVGDLTLVVFPGVSFEVMDKNYNVVASYETVGDALAGYAVLDNGNIFVSEYDYVHPDSTDYDVSQDGQKMKVKNSIVSVTDGSVTPVAGKYLLYNVLTNATASIDTPLNVNSMSNVSGKVTVKEGTFLAQMAKVENETINSRNLTFVAMRNDGTLIEELPSLVANQFGYLGFFNEETPIVAANFVGNVIRYYEVDEATGKLSLFFNMMDNGVQTIQKLDKDLMIYEDTIYGVDGRSYVSLVSDYEVDGDMVITKDYGDMTIYSGLVNESYYGDKEVGKYEMPYTYSGYYDYLGNGIVAKYDSYNSYEGLYNRYGEELLREGSTQTITVTEGNSYAVMSGNLEILSVQIIGDVILVHAKEIFRIDSYSGEDFILPPEYDVYYVLK